MNRPNRRYPEKVRRSAFIQIIDKQERCQDFLAVKIDELVKSGNSVKFVIPAKAGIKLFKEVLDPGFRRDDALRDLLR
jgi:hypothetical protein